MRVEYLKRGRDVIKVSNDKNKLLSIVNSSLFWIWEVNENFHFTNTNSIIGQYLGYSNSEILNKHLFEIINRKDLIRISELLNNVNKETSIFFNSMFIHKDGSSKKFETNCVYVVDDRNSIIGLQGISRIINEENNNEKKSIRDIVKFTKLNNLKDLIIDEISRELRNSAQIIISISQMLYDENPNNLQMKSIINSGRSISAVLDVTNHFANMINGSEVRNERILLTKLIDNSFLECENKMKNGEIVVVRKFNPSLVLYTTPLMSEILKTYMYKITADFEGTKEIIVEVKRVDGYNIILIKDFGDTIPADERKTFFTKGVRVSENISRESLLGAAIGKEIIEIQNGKIWIEPNEPSGNCLNIKISSKTILSKNIKDLWE